MFPTSEGISPCTCCNDNPDGGEVQQPDEQCWNHRYPYIVSVYPGRFGHAECRGGNQCNHCRADAFEYTLHNGVVLEVVKEQRYGEDDEKRRKYGSQCSDYAPSYSPQPVAYENGYVDGKDARSGLWYGKQVDEIFFGYPVSLGYDFIFYQRYHGIAAADGKGSYLKENGECFKIYIHIQNVVIYFISFSSFSSLSSFASFSLIVVEGTDAVDADVFVCLCNTYKRQ